LAASVATEAFVVTTCQPVAIRAAERTGAILQDLGVERCRLIINSFEPMYYASAPDSSPLAIIDETCLQLLAIIPFDPGVMILQAEGRMLSELRHSDVPIAYQNLISRLEGKNIPLFTGFRQSHKSKLMNSL
jgi:septum site-determining protein MinD